MIHGIVVNVIDSLPMSEITSPRINAFLMPNESAMKPTKSMKNDMDAEKTPKIVPRLAAQEGHKPRRVQENASRNSCQQAPQRTPDRAGSNRSR